MKKNPTLTELNIWYLERQGAIEVLNTKTSKYRVFRYPNRTDNYYVGRGGALRKGRTVAKSISVNSAKLVRQAWADAQKNPELLTQGAD